MYSYGPPHMAEQKQDDQNEQYHDDPILHTTKYFFYKALPLGSAAEIQHFV